MCQFLSGLLNKSGRVYFAKLDDSHTNIYKQYDLTEAYGRDNPFVKFEITPLNDKGVVNHSQLYKCMSVDDWTLIIDELPIPIWYSQEVTKFITIIKEELSKWIKEHIVTASHKEISSVVDRYFVFNSYLTVLSPCEVYSFGTSNIVMQEGGEVCAYDKSTIEVHSSTVRTMNDYRGRVCCNYDSYCEINHTFNGTVNAYDTSLVGVLCGAGEGFVICWQNSRIMLDTLWDKGNIELHGHSILTKKRIRLPVKTTLTDNSCVIDTSRRTMRTMYTKPFNKKKPE
jgi:hypothetical protein